MPNLKTRKRRGSAALPIRLVVPIILLLVGGLAFAGDPAGTTRSAERIPWRGGGSFSTLTTPVCTSPALSYFGGPIVQSPIIVPVYWSSAVNAALVANIPQFYADVTNSTYWSWLVEYDSVGRSPGTNQAMLAGTATAGVTITPLKCAPGGANCALTDLDVQNELARQINLATLPAPALDCTGNVKTIYMVHFPPNVSLIGPLGAGKSCVANGFCAYHYTGTFGPSSLPLIYAPIMDYFTGPCAAGCGAESTGLARTTDTASHELVEAVTDADIGLDTAVDYAYPAGWADNFNSCGEIADICAGGAVGDTINVSGRSWVVQQLWSNSQGKCTSTGAAPAICSGTTVTGCRPCSCGDNGVACNGADPVCETSPANALYGGCEACTSQSNNCAPGDTCQQSATASQDDICVCPFSAPIGSPALTETQPSPGTTRLSWTYGGADATAFDAVRGDLALLRASGFVVATTACLGDGVAGPLDDPTVPSPGAGFWYLVRASNCGGKGSYGSAARDTGISASGHDCH